MLETAKRWRARAPDGRHAISASQDGTLKVWSIESGEELHTLEGHTGSVRAVAVTLNGRRVITASVDHTLKVWDLENGDTYISFSGDSPIRTFAASPNGSTIVVGEVSGRVHILRQEEINSH